MELQESAPAKNIGLEISEKDLDLVGGEVVGKVVAKHQGSLGWLELSLKGGFSAKPFLHKGIDFLEEKIPGDQSMWAEMAKKAVDKAFN